jgi:hypothetical protein
MPLIRGVAAVKRRRSVLPRIAGVDLGGRRIIKKALTYIYGIGDSTSEKILKKTGIGTDVRAKNLSDADTGKLRQVIENEYKVATVVCDTARVFRCVGSERTQTHARARGPSGVPARRSANDAEVPNWRSRKRRSPGRAAKRSASCRRGALRT